MAHLEDKQERDFERNKRVREENQVQYSLELYGYLLLQSTGNKLS